MVAETIAAEKRMTLEEYAEHEFNSKIRNEFINGKLHPMPYTSPNHGQIVWNLNTLLGQCLWKSKSTAFAENRMIFAEGCDNIYYPDAVIFEEAPINYIFGQKMHAFSNPAVLMEVLSPTTEETDRGEKWKCYRRIPSLKQYFLITQDEILIEVFTRKSSNSDEWIFRSFSDENHKIQIGECNIPIIDIYHKIEFAKGEANTDSK